MFTDQHTQDARAPMHALECIQIIITCSFLWPKNYSQKIHEHGKYVIRQMSYICYTVSDDKVGEFSSQAPWQIHGPKNNATKLHENRPRQTKNQVKRQKSKRSRERPGMGSTLIGQGIPPGPTSMGWISFTGEHGVKQILGQSNTETMIKVKRENSGPARTSQQCGKVFKENW